MIFEIPVLSLNMAIFVFMLAVIVVMAVYWSIKFIITLFIGG